MILSTESGAFARWSVISITDNTHRAGVNDEGCDLATWASGELSESKRLMKSGLKVSGFNVHNSHKANDEREKESDHTR
jgi:hypothetical protein